MKDWPLKELLTLLSFALGAFRSTPEGRARRAALRLIKKREDHLKDRYKFIKRTEKDIRRNPEKFTPTHLADELAKWDQHHPEP